MMQLLLNKFDMQNKEIDSKCDKQNENLNNFKSEIKNEINGKFEINMNKRLNEIDTRLNTLEK